MSLTVILWDQIAIPDPIFQLRTPQRQGKKRKNSKTLEQLWETYLNEEYFEFHSLPHGEESGKGFKTLDLDGGNCPDIKKYLEVNFPIGKA